MGRKDIYKDGINTQFSKTNQPANAGRKPSKLKKFIKDFDVSKLDVDILARNIIFNYSYADIKKLYEGLKDKPEIQDSLPVGIAVLISGMYHDIKRGDNKITNSLLDRIYGKPVDFTDMEYGKRIEQIEQLINGNSETDIDTDLINDPYNKELKRILTVSENEKMELQNQLTETNRKLNQLLAEQKARAEV
ncbi:MAG: hypothetical protein FWB73_00920 [Treponema sp.]|nr:hypothetical protein [Treponema sp.]